MAQSANLLVPALLLLLLAQGARSENCTPASVEVLQTSYGEKAGVDTVFDVTVKNKCQCAVKGVLLSADGFSSSIPVDPKLFRKEGDDYLVGDGNLILSDGSVEFRYASERAFKMSTAGVQGEDCSGVHQFIV